MGIAPVAGLSIRQSTAASSIVARIESVLSKSESSTTFQHFFLFLLFPSSASWTTLPRSSASRTLLFGIGDGCTGIATLFEIAADERTDALARTTSQLGRNASVEWTADSRSRSDVDTANSTDGNVRSS